MPMISKEEYRRRFGPVQTTLSFGSRIPLSRVPIFGHDMSKPFEERFHVHSSGEAGKAQAGKPGREDGKESVESGSGSGSRK